MTSLAKFPDDHEDLWELQVSYGCKYQTGPRRYFKSRPEFAYQFVHAGNKMNAEVLEGKDEIQIRVKLDCVKCVSYYCVEV